MELPEENKRTGLLALAVLGVLLVAVLTVFTVFDGSDGGDEGGGSPAPTATTGPGGSGSGSGEAADSGADDAKGGAVDPIMTSAEATAAHEAMAQYMAGLNTYDHTTGTSAWSAPLLRLTTNDTRMKQVTSLPTGKEWATCQAERCSAKGTAVVVRDAIVSSDLVRGSGRSISSLVKVTATRTADGRTTTESNRWLVSVKEVDGRWLVSGFDVFGLGDVGASDDSGA
ncbi:hypothetical protein AQI95_02120 [Streptomyces yokosukanensis]|uniref:Mce-associated membrane protein n=1 Tax=Streptomyces yokosukanensis TaxID=67386 RepID=A0A117Q5V4_9ACTN|nr:hypothetical protein [Streptomyces yokosukanensis]KUN10528.1 hypothetical protein AQI95_02120 [Streptomyces yokosukanensis]